jgi:halimadienyl-diphosphate synthase
MEELKTQTLKLLKDIGPGRMMSTAYDTAWVARLCEFDEPIGKQSLNWIRENQLQDGSWGASYPHYSHDRFISTLAAMVALTRWGNDKDQVRIQRALPAMDRAARGLPADEVGETVGFEMIVPTLLREAKSLGIIRRQNDVDLPSLVYSGGRSPLKQTGNVSKLDFLSKFQAKREAKLQALSQLKINRHVTIAFSAEMAGTDGIHLLDIPNLQESNGSVGHSPSATAYYLLHIKPQDPAALKYIRLVIQENDDDGGAPNVAPFDTFEQAWSLWNLALPGGLDQETLALCQPHLDFLQKSWVPGKGIGFASEYTPKDGDDTGLIFDVLTRYGRTVDVEAVLRYERESHFECFAIETSPSISANIHILGALHAAGLGATSPSVQKIIHFLKNSRRLDAFWFDKWHASPYYPTSHAIIAHQQDKNNLHQVACQTAVDWLISTQKQNGSWGYYGPTAEETAYALQALFVWKRMGHHIPIEILKRGLGWLAANHEPPHPPLWIGKCLYSPRTVVRSAILSALIFGSQENIL